MLAAAVEELKPIVSWGPSFSHNMLAKNVSLEREDLLQHSRAYMSCIAVCGLQRFESPPV